MNTNDIPLNQRRLADIFADKIGIPVLQLNVTAGSSVLIIDTEFSEMPPQETCNNYDVVITKNHKKLNLYKNQ